MTSIKSGIRQGGSLVFAKGILVRCGIPLFVGCALLVLAGCSEDEKAIGEAVSRPDTPVGLNTVYCLELVEYVSGGAQSTQGHAVEYRFDLDSGGIHDYTSWNPVATATAEWPDTGRYEVRAQARCATHNEILSPWSSGTIVAVIEPPVTRPLKPTGSDSTETGDKLWYCTGGAVSAQGDPVEYRFDFDADGQFHDYTGWSIDLCEWRRWPSPGEYLVRAQARSAVNTLDLSPWSEGLTVKVTSRYITTPTVPLGPSSPAMSGDLFCTGGSVSIEGDPIEYTFLCEAVGGAKYQALGMENSFDVTPWDTIPCAAISFPRNGVYIVRARARSATQTDKQSAWSLGLTVIVGRIGEHPTMRFSTHITEVLNGSSRTISRPYNRAARDTVGMFRPFSIGYHGVSPNGPISAYLHGPIRMGLYGPPVMNIPGENCWNADISDTLLHFSNTGEQVLESGTYFISAQCFDSEGFVSPVNPYTKVGVCRFVVNHDPDTRILYGTSFYTDQSGTPHEDLIDFSDGEPDTLPYNSILRMHYLGWDDARDSLEFNDPPLPIRFQFKYERWGYGINGGISTNRPPWMPTEKAEDTACDSEEDSTTMRIGSYDYRFLAKAFDEQYRRDYRPDTVSFAGNFPPMIDKISIAYDSIPYTPELELTDITGDTVFIAIGQPLSPRSETDYVSAFLVEYDPVNEVFNQFFKFYINGGGHDDRRDPPGSGIKGWWFWVKAEQYDYYYRGEQEWLYDFDPDTLLQELSFRLVIPRDPDCPNYPRPDPDYINHPRIWMGNQDLTVRASDIHIAERFDEGIRGISPEYVDGDPCNALISPGRWVTQTRAIANYARTDTYNGWFYIKLVY